MWKNKLQGSEPENPEIWAPGARQGGQKQVQEHRDPFTGCPVCTVSNPQTLLFIEVYPATSIRHQAHSKATENVCSMLHWGAGERNGPQLGAEEEF